MGGSIFIDDLGLSDTARHDATVLMDQASDRIQIFVDGAMVWDEQGAADIQFGILDSGEIHRKDAWQLGSQKEKDFVGEIYDVRLDATADFVDDPTLGFTVDDSQLVA